ncbi:MAG TPA: DUF3263 domain-containing protein [Actinomycetota bacterium]|nr:DUF3263 domain-containing protein [Actinomycetota bacterium]
MGHFAPEPDVEPGLDERSREILDFERAWWQEPGRKARAIRDRFDLSAARYYQLLNRLIDEPEAERYDPMLVKRLRRLRAARRRQRFSGNLGYRS